MSAFIDKYRPSNAGLDKPWLPNRPAKMSGAGKWLDGNNASSFVVDKGERYLAVAAFGFYKGYCRDWIERTGVHLDLIVGAASTLLGGYASACSSGDSAAAKHLERVGDAGMTCWIHSTMVGLGAKTKGLKPGETFLHGADTVGALPSAPAGAAYLTPEEMARYSMVR